MKKSDPKLQGNIWQEKADYFSLQIIGARDYQEDYAVFQTSPSRDEILAVLSDGMGGHTSGEVASHAAVDAFVKTYTKSEESSIAPKLKSALQNSNNELASLVAKDATLDGMGCTLVAAVFNSSGLQWVSVGDSPLFLYRNKRITRLNEDHSMAPVIADSLRQGKITKEEAENHPHRNALRSALMGSPLELVDAPTSPFPLLAGDIIILASDGLLTLSDDEIANLIFANQASTADMLASALLSAVEKKNRPRQDNTTVQIISALRPTPTAPILKRMFWWASVTAVVVIMLSAASLMLFAAFADKKITNQVINELNNVIHSSFQQEGKIQPSPVLVPEEITQTNVPLNNQKEKPKEINSPTDSTSPSSKPRPQNILSGNSKKAPDIDEKNLKNTELPQEKTGLDISGKSGPKE
jgi:serine/threonine protein phosphatase PrpC